MRRLTPKKENPDRNWRELLDVTRLEGRIFEALEAGNFQDLRNNQGDREIIKKLMESIGCTEKDPVHAIVFQQPIPDVSLENFKKTMLHHGIEQVSAFIIRDDEGHSALHAIILPNEDSVLDLMEKLVPPKGVERH